MAGLLPEDMKVVMAMRENAQKLSQGDQALNMKQAELQRTLAGDDLVDFGGVQIPRSKVPAMVTALADAKYKQGKLGLDETLQQYDIALKQARQVAALAAASGNRAQMIKTYGDIQNLMIKRKALEEMGNETNIDNVPLATQIAAGVTPTRPPREPGVKLTKVQGLGKLKENFFKTGAMGAMLDLSSNAQQRYAVAKKLYDKVYDPATGGDVAANKATDMINYAEKTLWENIDSDPENAESWKRKFRKDFGYVPERPE